jgi:large subunit ribosomal protein L23
VVFNVADGFQAGDQGCCRSCCSVKVKAVNTLVRKGKVKRFRGIRGRQSLT